MYTEKDIDNMDAQSREANAWREWLQETLREPVLTTGSIAKICHVSPGMIARWVDSELLKGYRSSVGNEERCVEPQDLGVFLKKCNMDFLLDGKQHTIYTTGEAAKICCASVRMMNKWVDQGRLGYRLPASQDRRVDESSLRAFMEKHNMPNFLDKEHEVLTTGQVESLLSVFTGVAARWHDEEKLAGYDWFKTLDGYTIPDSRYRRFTLDHITEFLKYEAQNMKINITLTPGNGYYFTDEEVAAMFSTTKEEVNTWCKEGLAHLTFPEGKTRWFQRDRLKEHTQKRNAEKEAVGEEPDPLPRALTIKIAKSTRTRSA